MIVKNILTPIERVRALLKEQNGIILASDLTKHGNARTYLSILERNGEIQRVSRGMHTSPDAMIDEMFSLQAKYKSVIFSNEIALYLLDLTDRTPYTILS